MQITATVTQENKNTEVVMDKQLQVCSHAYAFELIINLLWPYILVVLLNYCLNAVSFLVVTVYGKYCLD